MMRLTYHKKGAQRRGASLFEIASHRKLSPEERKRIRVEYEPAPDNTQEIEKLEIEEDGSLTFYTSRLT